ncbi:translation initiation factor IF-2-like [Eriocheir sinensis]|uniref:translation initiation factor IF-2-like n=1 Tax=Eriocheir sinensis TaxID=95602 RepID=UPI0021C75101|nr:translation initiation factor IF-2-like [Eriocheir sinensis]
MGTRGGGGGGDVLAPRRPCPPTRQGPDTKGVVEEGRGRPASKVSKIAGMFQAGGGGEEGCGGGGAGEGGAPSGPSAATVVRTESHLARFNTARALFEKMGQGDARPQRTRTAAPATASLTNKAPPSPARPAANGHAHHDDGSRGGLAGLGGLRRPGSASSRSLSASSTDSDPPGRRWPPSARAADPADPSRPAEQPDARRWPPHRAADPPHRAADPPRTNGEGTGVRRSSRPEKPAKPDTLADRRAAAASHDAHQELLARHKNWFQSFAKNRPSGPGRPPSPGKADPRPASPTQGEATWGAAARRLPRRPQHHRQDRPQTHLHPQPSPQSLVSTAPPLRLRGDSLDSSSGGGGDWRRERAAILLGECGWLSSVGRAV